MCTKDFNRVMSTVDLYGNRGLDSRTHILAGLVAGFDLGTHAPNSPHLAVIRADDGQLYIISIMGARGFFTLGYHMAMGNLKKNGSVLGHFVHPKGKISNLVFK